MSDPIPSKVGGIAAARGAAAIHGEDRVKDVIKRHPAAQAVFARHGMDLCCGGEHPISTAAAAAGVDAEALLKELNAAAGAPRAREAPNWPRRPESLRRRPLDVSGLEPPEPLVRILSELQGLGPDEVLEVAHFREPVALYALLEEGGFAYTIEKLGESKYRLGIWRKK